MNPNSKLMINYMALMACLALPAVLGCDRNADAVKSASMNQPTVNVYGARKLDSDVAKTEIEEAWNNYLASVGVESPVQPIGFTDTEIEYIESEIRQRLPEDLKAFLRICLANGSFFNDNFEFMSAEEIVDWWKFMVELNYDEPFGTPNPSAVPTWFEPYLIPLMRYDVYEIHFDIRTGKVIEMMDGPCGMLANSLSEMLNELAAHHRAGRTVELVSFEGNEVGPFLNSEMWDVYEKK